jgi:hypothetical protein
MKIYKSNKANKGVAASFSFNSKEQSFFLQLIKQVSYDESRHIGSFSGGDKITVKFTIWEMGALLSCFDTNKEYSLYHKTKDTNVAIKFAPYIVAATKEQKGFGISINKLADSSNTVTTGWLLPISFPEKETIKAWVNNAFVHCFNAEYAEEKKQYKEREEKKAIKSSSPVESSVKPVAAEAEEIQEEI